MKQKKATPNSTPLPPTDGDKARHRSPAGHPGMRSDTLDANHPASPSSSQLGDELESTIIMLEDLIAIAIDEIGNDTGRAISVLLPTLRTVRDLKGIHERLLRLEAGP